jgi:hypothetical protein
MVEYPAGQTSPNTVASPPGAPISPSNTFKTYHTVNSGTTKTDTTTDTTKKKKGLFSFFKKDKKGTTGQPSTVSVLTPSPGKSKMKKTSKKGQLMNSEDDRSI